VRKTLRDKLADGQVLLGLAHMYPSAGIIEGMGAGWDFSWIDMQHGQHDFASTLNAIRAAEVTGLHTLVRVPGHGPDTMSKVADLDPDAVMAPMVNTADGARAVVDALRFPPLGKRSYGGRRVIDRHGRDFYKDRDLLVVAQIETLEALERVDEIAAVEGVDVLFFGPDDMKVRMGLDLATAVHENDQLLEAQRKVAVAAKTAGKWAGSVAVTPQLLKLNIEAGYQLIVGGGDIMFLRNGAADALRSLRGTIDNTTVNTPSGDHGLYGR
jgi:4-hydroxy-2-oxoheptanedioate aldolase